MNILEILGIVFVFSSIVGLIGVAIVCGANEHENDQEP